MTDPFPFVPVIAVLIVGVILIFGIGSFAKGGDFNKRNANKIMRLRILAQAIAVLVILIFVTTRGG